MQILLIGLISGLSIAILALAFTTVHVSTRVFHVAVGGIYTLVAFVALAALNLGLPWYLAAVVATLLGVCISIACEVFNHSPLESAGAPSGAHLVSSLGIYIILAQVASLIWGDEPKVLRTGASDVVHFWSISLTHSQLLILLGGAALLTLFYLWLHLSSLGLEFRALADNPTEVALRGYSIRRLRLLAFGVSGALAAAAALLVAYDVGFDAYGGLSALLLGVVAAFIGGRASFYGPVLGGLLLGVVRTEVVWLSSARWQEAVTFIILGLFLYVRPNGLVGRAGRLESQS
jgi:branched-chain amino acid transport system permease protein